MSRRCGTCLPRRPTATPAERRVWPAAPGYRGTVSETGRVAVEDLTWRHRVWLLREDGQDVEPAPDGVHLCHGQGLPYPRPFTGVYVAQGVMWLQVGEERWDTSDIALVVKVDERKMRQTGYELHLRSREVVPVTMRFPLLTMVMIFADPTYDEEVSWCYDPVTILPYIGAGGSTSAHDVRVHRWAAEHLDRWTEGWPREAYSNREAHRRYAHRK